MKRRSFLNALIAGPALTMTANANGENPGETQAPPVLASESVLYESPDPKGVYAYSPGITRLESGRLVATMDQGGPGLDALPGIKKLGKKSWRGRIYTSDDRGRSWTFRADMPLIHARPFAAGKSVYVLGHRGDLGVMRSDDGGDTWSGPHWIDKTRAWHQAPCNVLYTRGRIFLVMECKTDPKFKFWPVSILAPIVLSADVNADLTQRESWTFSNALSFNSAVEQAGAPHLIGVPFFPTGVTALLSPGGPRYMAPMGWLETNLVQFTDPDHVWHDPSGRTYHLWMRAHTGATNLAAIAKAVEADDGSITVSLETAPSREPILYVPCPGGHMKFHILYDKPAKLFWLLSSQSTDSMTRPERLPRNRHGLPNNERHRLVLHFSKNCVDWCFACRIADSGDPGQGRHYASMTIDGDDLHVLARSGDARAENAHDGNLITFHTVKDFRKLVY